MRAGIERFLRIVVAAMLVAIGVVLTGVATPPQALAGFEFAVGSALLVAADKIRRALGEPDPAVPANPAVSSISTVTQLKL